MSMQDTIGDMLTRIRNGQKSRFSSVSMPSSKAKLALAKLFQEEGYIKSYTVSEGVKPVLTIGLKYIDKEPVIQHLKRISKPGLRIYRGRHSLPSVCDGLGVVAISTSAGLMSDKMAAAKGLGGEVICSIA